MFDSFTSLNVWWEKKTLKTYQSNKNCLAIWATCASSFELVEGANEIP